MTKNEMREFLKPSDHLVTCANGKTFLYVGDGHFISNDSWMDLASFYGEWAIVKITEVVSKSSLAHMLAQVESRQNYVPRVLWVDEKDIRNTFSRYSELIVAIESAHERTYYGYDMEGDKQYLTCANAWDYFNCSKPIYKGV